MPVPASSRCSIGACEHVARDRVLDVLIGRVQRADALPFRRVGLEERSRLGRARLAHMGQALQVGFERRRVGERGQGASELGTRAHVGGAVEDPASFLEALEQPRVAKKLQMPRYPGLALPHDLDQLADRELGLTQEKQKPQPSGITRRAQHGHEVFPCII